MEIRRRLDGPKQLHTSHLPPEALLNIPQDFAERASIRQIPWAVKEWMGISTPQKTYRTKFGVKSDGARIVGRSQSFVSVHSKNCALLRDDHTGVLSAACSGSR